jgi:hypothetical protein
VNLIAAWPRLMRPDVATEYVGGPAIMAALLKQKLLKPKVSETRLVAYDRVALDLAIDRFKSLEGED